MQCVSSAWEVAAGADVLLVLVDAARQLVQPDPRVERLLGEVRGEGGDWRLVIGA